MKRSMVMITEIFLIFLNILLLLLSTENPLSLWGEG